MSLSVATASSFSRLGSVGWLSVPTMLRRTALLRESGYDPIRPMSKYIGYGPIKAIEPPNTPSLIMAQKVSQLDHEGSASITFTTKFGVSILNDPLLNKGTAFTLDERQRLGLDGLLPPCVSELDKQVKRVHAQFLTLVHDAEKYKFAAQIRDRNEILFYRWLSDNIELLAPIIYTPVVAQACREYGTNFGRTRGMFFSPQHQTRMLDMIYHWPVEDVDVIVVTDGGRILGLGDLGVHGMAIPIGKLSLYVAVGGIHPARTLPIVLDVGTNNTELVESGNYLGTKCPRISGMEYYLMVDELMRAVKRRWPRCLVQFEDFTSVEAPIVLETWRDKLSCFNDDIQGTGCVVLAGLINAMRINALEFKDIRCVVLGGGSAGLGVCDTIIQYLVNLGLTESEAKSRLVIFDKDGLLTVQRKDLKSLNPFMRDLAVNPSWNAYDLKPEDSIAEVINKMQPHALLGLTGCANVFTEEVVKAMNSFDWDPVIFPLSNPTSLAECSFENAIAWTEGRCIFGSGSPFAPTEYNGKMYFPSQTNNMYAFPGVGLGVVVSQASRVTNEMFLAAAEVLANSIPLADLKASRVLFPPLCHARKVSKSIGRAVGDLAVRRGLARNDHAVEKVKADGQLSEQWIESRMFSPKYGHIVHRSPRNQDSFHVR